MSPTRHPPPVPRTLYAKGFPEAATHEEITEFFAKVGDVNRVQKRFFPARAGETERKAKTSAYVEFAKEEDLQKAKAAELEYNGVKLEIMMKEAHLAESAAKSGKNKRPREEDGEDVPPAKVERVVLPENASLKFTGVGEIEYFAVKKAIVETEQCRYAPTRRLCSCFSVEFVFVWL